MKLLLFSDLHTDVNAASRLVAMSRSVDVLVGAGDFGNVRRNVRACIDVLSSVDKPCVLVAGNNESTDELVDACRGWSQASILHGTGTRVLDFEFFGVAGGIPVTPFGSWSYDFSEEQAAEFLRDCPAGCVLVSHSPPQGAVDRSSGGQCLGSVAVREAVLRAQPALVVCGHIHASAGRHELIGGTPIVNAGPGGVRWELHGNTRS